MLKNSFLLVFLSLCSCGYFKPEQELESVARVGKNFLYKSDIASLVPGGTSKEDSLLLVRDYIDRWATQELLIDAAQRNLNETKNSKKNKNNVDKISENEISKNKYMNKKMDFLMKSVFYKND